MKQLIVLSRLRKIENLTIKITEEMPISYNIETDYLYQQGEKRGIEKGMSQKDYENKFNFVKSLLENTDFTDEKIGTLVDVSLNFILEVKRLLKLNK